MKIRLLLLVIMAFTTMVSGQSVCSEAVTAVSGVNTIPANSNNNYWYKYTMPLDGTLQVATTQATPGIPSVFMYVNACANVYTVGSGKATAMGLKQGDEVYIEWPGGRSFSWNLAANAPKPGDTRELAVEAVVGANHASVTSYDDYWYYFTMPSDGKLRITSSAIRTVYVLREDGSEISSGNENTTAPALIKDEKVYIRWRTRGSGNFDWNLAVVPSAPGDACTLPADAVNGANYLPASTDQYHWYRYTMQETGKLQITSASSEHINIYRSCNGTDYKYGQGSVNVNNLQQGEDVLIRWSLIRGGDMNWNLAVMPYDTGENCTTAASANKGTNHLPGTTADEYWYKYTMPEDGRMQITSSTNEVKVYEGTCSDLSEPLKDNYGYGFILSKGQEVLISLNVAGGGSLDWDLSVIPLEMGEDCRSAIHGIMGTNNLPPTSHGSYWYKYTMFTNGKLRIRSFTSKAVLVYRNGCEDLTVEGYGQGNINVTNLKKGEQVFIQWETATARAGFDWELSELTSEEGDLCSLPVEASPGTNTLSVTNNNFYWYRYTMPIDGKLQITSASGEYLSVFSGSCEALFVEKQEYENISVSTLEKDEVVYIRWELYNGGGFDWNLSVSPFEEGENCITTAAAKIGTNTTPATPYWFKYEVPATGKYSISLEEATSINTHLMVYSDCDGTLMGENDNNQHGLSLLTLSLTAGESIYIYWNDPYTREGFDWAITSNAQSITFPALPDVTLGNDPLELTATASSGLPVTYTSSDESVAIVSGSTITIVGAGISSITACQAGNEIYDAATPVVRELSVYKASQTITIAEISDQFTDAAPFTVDATSTSGLDLDYSLNGPAKLDHNLIILNGIEGVVKVTVRQVGNQQYAAAENSITFKVIAPPMPSFSCDSLTLSVIEKNNVSCHQIADGSVLVSASGGQPPYLYSLDGTNFQNRARFNALAAGKYTITVKDANECTLDIETYITEPDALRMLGEVRASTELSGNGSIELTISGGTAPYYYSWNNNEITATLKDLPPGEYVLTVTDAQGCISNQSFVVASEILTSIEEDHKNEIMVYPNPTINGVLYIDVPTGTTVKKAMLYNWIGSKVTEVSLSGTKNHLDIRGLKPGSYLLILDNGNSYRLLIH